jgi:peroxiredoxin
MRMVRVTCFVGRASLLPSTVSAKLRAMALRPLALVLTVVVCAVVGSAARSFADGPRPRGWAGIAMSPASATDGVRVEHIVRGSPAQQAGLQVDDRITLVDATIVATSRDVVRSIGLHAVGEAVSLTFVRAGKSQQVSVVLADFPSSDTMLRMDHVGSPAPAWDGLEPTSGFPASLVGLRGHVVVVDFWATWCQPCREMAPVLSGWQARYGAQGLNVVGVTTDPADAAARFKEQLDLRYPMASDPRASTSAAYGVSALPTLFVIDKRGVVRDVIVGVDPGQDGRMEALIRSLLAEPATNP